MSSTGKSIMLGTAGHVDHGKTALVKLLTGCDTDTLAVEKQRGLTIELGFAPCQMADKRILGIVDVPGHVDFIRNMAAGAHGIDVVILVVAADDGIMPQTREHLDILTLMGVRHGLVAVTKIDMVEDELREIVVEEVRDFVRGTFLQAAEVRPISNITGEGFDGFFAALNRAVDAAETRGQSGLFRQWVERSFHVRGFGTVVSGIPTSGEVRVGDRLTLVPGGQVGRVRGMEVYGEAAEVGRAGECIALNLADIDAEQLTRGRALCQGDCFEPVTMVEAELTLLATVPRGVRDYVEVHVHVGTAEIMANVALLEKQEIAPGESQFVQLRLREPAGIAPGERFVIRSGVAGLAGGHVTTVGGGRVLGTSNTRLRRRRAWTIERLQQRREAIDSATAWCAQCLKEEGKPLSAPAIARLAQMPEPQAQGALEALQADGSVREVTPGQFAHRQSVAGAAEAILAAAEEFHDANPMRLGVEQAQLFAQLDSPRALLDAALGDLLGEGKVRRHGAVLALADRTADISPQDRRLLEGVEGALRDGHLAPPGPADLADSLGEPLSRVEKAIDLLTDAATAVRLDRKVVMHRDAVEAAKKVVVDLFAKSGSFETVQFRDALGVSRKFAVPLLDYFDTIRLTVRSGSRRTPGVEARRRAEADDL